MQSIDRADGAAKACTKKLERGEKWKIKESKDSSPKNEPFQRLERFLA